jgi:uncharacterized cupredoxin-like copper-binding protein
MMKHQVYLGAALLASVLLAACAGGGAPAAKSDKGGAAQQVRITGLDIRYEPTTLTVRSGSPVRLTLNNTGALVHDWVVDDLEGKKVSTGDVGAGRSGNVEFTPTRPGTYQFYCVQAGHKEAGMVGTLTVQ